VQTLYESALAFGMRKALQTEQGKGEMAARIQQLEASEKDLERQVGVAQGQGMGACRGSDSMVACSKRPIGRYLVGRVCVGISPVLMVAGRATA
jgi:hypothetical protein